MTLLAGAALMLGSCNIEREVEVDDYAFAEDEVVFKVASVQTRSKAEAEPKTIEVASIKAGNGDMFAFEETVTSLDYDSEAPATRGTPAFTGNVTKVYPSLYAVAMKSDGSKAFANSNLVNGVEYKNEKENIYSHRYGEDIWGDENDPESKLPTDFFMRMPGTGGGVTLTESPYSQENGSISFTYKSPAAAAAQQDILFSWYKRTGKTNCEAVTFYHALTGIKFSNFYTNKGISDTAAVTKTIIKEVTLSGLKDEGSCTMKLKGATSSKTAAQWSNVQGNTSFTLSHSDTTDYTGSTMGLDTLLNATGKIRNVNDKDGTLTFWVVPQAFQDSTVMIKVKCDLELVKGNNTRVTVPDTTITVSLGARDWKAGELHTFTLKPVFVGVELTDSMSVDKFTKSNVRVENTGNVYEYVRVNMIGNWVGEVQTAENVYDENEVILMGFTTSDKTDSTEVEFWNDKDGKTHYGVFTRLTPQSYQVPATSDSTYNNWVRYDKYYYYIKPIGPNDAITDQLFQKYEVGPSPEFWIVDKWGERRKARNVHLVIDMMVQAVPAPVDENGNVLDNEDNEGYIRAWLEAYDQPKTNYEYLLDL